MKLKISSLKLNYNLYPREGLDEYNVNRLVEALKADVTLLPVTVDKKTKIVIDGFHRIEAHNRLYGEKAEISVIYKEYSNIKDMFLDSVKLNASQGKMLDEDDRIHCQKIAKDMKIKPEFLAIALSITAESISEPKATAISRPKDYTAVEQRSSEEKRKKKTDRQLFYIRQVINFIDDGDYDTEHPLLQNALMRLQFLVNELAL